MSKRETIKTSIKGWLGELVYDQMQREIERVLGSAERIESADTLEDARLDAELRRVVHAWLRARWEERKP